MTPSLSRIRLVSMIVATALFMQNLDSSIITTALPAMARSFGADPVQMNVALTAYLFAVALFVPASGWLADRYGTRAIFRAAIAVFTLGSVMCGRAHSLEFLVASRIVQGAGGALMLPVGRLVLLRTVPKHQLVAAMAWVTIPGLLGPVLGPPVGGFIATYFSWQWIFDINVPIGVLGLVLVSLFIADMREDDPGPLDFWGLALSGAALAGLMGLLELVGRDVVPMWGLVAIGACSTAFGFAYLRRAKSQARPLLDISLMRLPGFAVSVLSGSLFRVGVGATPFLLPMMLQLGFGRTPLQSGLITFASALGAIGMKPATQAVLRRFGFRDTLVVNGVLCGLLLALQAAFRPSWPIAVLYAVLLFGGFLRSLQFTAFNSIAYAEVPPPRMSAATTLYSVLQQISLTIGIPISAFVVHLCRVNSGHTAPTVADFATAFLVVAGISILAGPAALILPKNAGAEMAGRPDEPEHRSLGAAPLEVR